MFDLRVAGGRERATLFSRRPPPRSIGDDRPRRRRPTAAAGKVGLSEAPVPFQRDSAVIGFNTQKPARDRSAQLPPAIAEFASHDPYLPVRARDAIGFRSLTHRAECGLRLRAATALPRMLFRADALGGCCCVWDRCRGNAGAVPRVEKQLAGSPSQSHGRQCRAIVSRLELDCVQLCLLRLQPSVGESGMPYFSAPSIQNARTLDVHALPMIRVVSGCVAERLAFATCFAATIPGAKPFFSQLPSESLVAALNRGRLDGGYVLIRFARCRTYAVCMLLLPSATYSVTSNLTECFASNR